MPLGLATDRPRRHVRLDTLVRLRWLAAIGQTTAVLVVRYVLDFDFPFWSCLAIISLSVLVNLVLRVKYPSVQWLEPARTSWLLAFDVAELAGLLYLTGGLHNPFAFLFLAPVLISATALPPRYTVMLGGFAVVCATLLAFFHYPLPWDMDQPLLLPPIFMVGEWVSILLAIGFIGLYAWQIAEESRQLADALAATELALAREHHLSQLDGLAAAAAHELGTPMSTISVIAKELERAIAPDAPHGDDVRLLREQAARCRDILAKLTELSASGQPFDRTPLTALLEEVVAPHRNFGVAIDVATPPDRGAGEPSLTRNPAILYGLGNIVENAVDFAHERVKIDAEWNDNNVAVVISDDGPGFAPEILNRLGEPYVSSRKQQAAGDSEMTGLGLGFFIAKTLLERSGATVSYQNRTGPSRGATVAVRWRREDFERASSYAVA